MAVDSNAPAVTLGFGTLAVPSKPLLWAVHAGLTAVPEKAVAQREWCWGGAPMGPYPSPWLWVAKNFSSPGWPWFCPKPAPGVAAASVKGSLLGR